MWDFMFEVIDPDSDLCGEQFFVECDTIEKAFEIANKNFPDGGFECIGKYTPWEAEMLGLDTY